MKCMLSDCSADALENSNYCRSHEWSEEIDRITPGDPPGSGGSGPTPADGEPPGSGGGGIAPTEGDPPGSGGDC